MQTWENQFKEIIKNCPFFRDSDKEIYYKAIGIIKGERQGRLRPSILNILRLVLDYLILGFECEKVKRDLTWIKKEMIEEESLHSAKSFNC